MSETPAKKQIFSIGHSNRGIYEFIAILERYGIKTLADVRSYPVSKRYPHFGKESLEKELPAHGIEYVWLKGLGGRRKGGYEAHMKTSEFAQSLDTLIESASSRETAFMCSELRWRECHRAFISDALARSGWDVVHIYDELESETHSTLPLL